MDQHEERLAKRIHILQSAFGPEMVLVDMDGDGGEEPYRILREIDISGKHYAVMEPVNQRDEDVILFRVDERRWLDHIEDEEEWEEVVDAIDEMLFFDER